MSEVLIPICAITMPFVMVVAILGLRQLNRHREMAHRERMKALGVGQPLPGGAAWPALAAMTIGGAMPASAFFCAWLASLTTHSQEDAWIAATVVGLGGVLGGTRLAARLVAAGPAQPASSALANGKPRFEPDAYDAIAQRG